MTTGRTFGRCRSGSSKRRPLGVGQGVGSGSPAEPRRSPPPTPLIFPSGSCYGFGSEEEGTGIPRRRIGRRQYAGFRWRGTPAPTTTWPGKYRWPFGIGQGVDSGSPAEPRRSPPPPTPLTFPSGSCYEFGSEEEGTGFPRRRIGRRRCAGFRRRGTPAPTTTHRPTVLEQPVPRDRSGGGLRLPRRTEAVASIHTPALPLGPQLLHS